MQEDTREPDEELYPCYDFNPLLVPFLDDGLCEHCRKWMTLECENLEDFVVEEEWDNEY